jgi:UPF0755 protein
MKAIKALITLGVVGGFLLAVAAGFMLIVSGGNPIDWARTEWLRFSLEQRRDELENPAGNDPTEFVIVIESGETPVMVANTLAAGHLISDAGLFVDYLRVEGLDTQIEAGTYFINQTQTIPEIARTIVDSSNSYIRFRVPEGSRIEEVAALIDTNPRFQFTGDDFLQVAGTGAVIPPELAQVYGIPAGASLEGFLFPDTYILSPNITVAGLRDELLNRFGERVSTQLIQDANNQGLSMRDAVTIASIIERESVHNDENAMIASVYRNRLDIGMKLDADPTVQYALNGSRGTWWPQITLADYRNVQSPYNTYLRQGLPPGPIANPALSAIEAAVYPEESTYFFFRVRCDGSSYHQFAETYDEHLANGCS